MPLDTVTGQICQYRELQTNLGWKGCPEVSSTTGCSEQGQLDEVALHASEVGGPTAPLGPCPSLRFCEIHLIVISCASVCVHGLLSHPCVPPRVSLFCTASHEVAAEAGRCPPSLLQAAKARCPQPLLVPPSPHLLRQNESVI